VSELTPTRSVVLELRDEQRAMREGHAFLDEKCLLLAGEIVRELNRYSALAGALRGANDDATRALVASIGRHGLDGLEVYPRGDLSAARYRQDLRSLMGVKLAEASLSAGSIGHANAIDASPEAERCRLACIAVIEQAAALGAVAGNLERLSTEYQRSLRRARALADVLLPEIVQVTGELETRLEELEQEDAIYMSRSTGPAQPAR